MAARHEAVVKLPIAELSNDLFRRSPGLFCADLFHPNQAGQEVWADAAYSVLEEVVAQASRAATTRPANTAI